jgi:hypothetical protein
MSMSVDFQRRETHLVDWLYSGRDRLGLQVRTVFPSLEEAVSGRHHEESQQVRSMNSADDHGYRCGPQKPGGVLESMSRQLCCSFSPERASLDAVWFEWTFVNECLNSFKGNPSQRRVSRVVVFDVQEGAVN